ncbi:AbrB/MazE/SpoVT family DNA-binding domain-containing protein [Sinobaca sp. H24]|uniref:AbrB/MazE/SpoVT family DNA-binding domain-containing protein n=1 Tax=Sinobaca sp. H24 TaxID=2923376 RepID=UPI0020796554|nr:AbrB/MazE/SpoVT family DNA-binding domain-containing protein [Sinobaca sp. H24]
MKTTAIIRKVDKLGRLILPAEFRRMLHLQVKDRVEIFTEDEKIILQKYQPDYPCALTGKVSDENFFLTKKILL